eukprot:1195813-Prorocentrum_minimum.AAC.4
MGDVEITDDSGCFTDCLQLRVAGNIGFGDMRHLDSLRGSVDVDLFGLNGGRHDVDRLWRLPRTELFLPPRVSRPARLHQRVRLHQRHHVRRGLRPTHAHGF